ncbi:MAG: hypothetical protein IIB44_02330 [Candidatus Marinimicrobia bacterium]|nr:hypothetical protein [Candidatus Neomarinimicrobiota bacterium]
MEVISPALGIESPTTVIKVVTDPFQMFADIRIDNRDLTTENLAIYDLDSPPNEIPLRVHILDQLDISEYENMLSSILSTGKLPGGEYTFYLAIRSGSSSGSLSLTDEVTEKIIVTSPTSLNLIAPGGELADTSQNTVFSTYPVFQWETEPCSNCESFIRVARFDHSLHGSPEDAVEDVTVYPMNQTEGWASVGVSTTIQYPFFDAVELVPGYVYVWQIKKNLPTTVGIESYLSPIWSLKIGDLTQPPEMGIENLHPLLQQLMDVLGEDQFFAYFGPDGVLYGYSPDGTYEINGIQVSIDAVYTLIQQFQNQSSLIINISVE